MCRNLNVTKAGYYAWRRRKPSLRVEQDVHLTRAIIHAHVVSRRSYGRPEDSRRIAVARHARIQQADCQANESARNCWQKAHSVESNVDCAWYLAGGTDIVNRQFRVERPNATWVSDITQFPTAEGWLYLAVVIDLYSRIVVGWSMSTNIDSELVISCAEDGLKRRPVKELVLHSDRGRQYTFTSVLRFSRST